METPVPVRHMTYKSGTYVVFGFNKDDKGVITHPILLSTRDPVPALQCLRNGVSQKRIKS